MGLLLKQLFNFLKLLNSETGENQIAAGVAVGFILGMTPALSLQTLLVFILLFVFRIQVGAAFLTAFFFKFVAYLLDPVFDRVGSIVLKAESLETLFTQMYNIPIVPLTRFNNSIVMGSAVITILSFPLVFWISRILIIRYRVAVVERFRASRFWKAFKATRLYNFYYTYDKLYGS